jgi:hypothetical protein
MGLKRTKLLNIQSVVGISTVGILTVGVTPTAGGVGIASTTYLRSVVMHNTGIQTAVSSLYIYPSSVSVSGAANPAYRISRVELSPAETFFFEANYPIVLTDRDKVVVEVTQSGTSPTGIHTVNFQILGDTDI